jgi:hypothetical protein
MANRNGDWIGAFKRISGDWSVLAGGAPDSGAVCGLWPRTLAARGCADGTQT